MNAFIAKPISTQLRFLIKIDHDEIYQCLFTAKKCDCKIKFDSNYNYCKKVASIYPFDANSIWQQYGIEAQWALVSPF